MKAKSYMLNKGLIKFEEWQEKAEEDFQSGNILLEHNGAPASIAFHAHQGVEKYLKGFIVFHGKSFEKTHHLDELIAECKKIDNSFEDFIDESATLNDYYIEARYPIDIKEDISSKEAKEAIEKATAIRDFVLSKVKHS